jgi:hypothetical protein
MCKYYFVFSLYSLLSDKIIATVKTELYHLRGITAGTTCIIGCDYIEFYVEVPKFGLTGAQSFGMQQLGIRSETGVKDRVFLSY